MAVIEGRFLIFKNTTDIVNEDEIKLITEYLNNSLFSVKIYGLIKQVGLNP
jgi:hypothetical protein